DRGRVVEGQGRRRRAAATGRADREEVRPKPGQAVGDVRRRALADADEGDDRGDADDDAEHRQRRAQPARAQPRQRQAQELQEAHATIRPSRRWTWRLADAAMSGSWVIRTIVRPAALSSWRS